MRIITLNVNGIRAAEKKGLFSWLERQEFDVCCLQEIKAGHDKLGPFKFPKNWSARYFPAKRPGYSGVGILSRTPPKKFREGYGVPEFDNEGRILEAQFSHITIVSLYVPSGSANPSRQESKDRFLNTFLPYLEKLRKKRKEYLICGDWNIAHKPIDLKNWKANQTHSGFLPHERDWLTRVFEELGFFDCFRLINSNPEQYTWWSNRGRAWDKNVGWRIDYQIGTPEVSKSAARACIYKKERFSDHAPLIMDYDFNL